MRLIIPRVAALLTGLSEKLKLGVPIQRVNESTGYKLRTVRRVDASSVRDLDADWVKEPLIVTNWCFRAKPGGPCVPPDMNWTHAALLERCGKMSVRNGVGNRYAQVLDKLHLVSEEDRKAWEARAESVYELSLEKIKHLYLFEWSFEDYHEFKDFHKHKTYPEHPFDFVLPITLKSLDDDWCPALLKEMRKKRLKWMSPETMFDLFERFDGNLSAQETRREGAVWHMAEFFISPSESFGYATHSHGGVHSIFQWVLEGRRVWQLVPPSYEAHRRLEPLGLSTEASDGTYLRAPVEVADEFPVFVTEVGPGDLLYMPVDFIHLVYSLSDSVSLSYQVPLEPEAKWLQVNRPLYRKLGEEL